MLLSAGVGQWSPRPLYAIVLGRPRLAFTAGPKRHLDPRQRRLSCSVTQPSATLPALDTPDEWSTHGPVESWVAFSDLHASTRSLDVCLEVLAVVKAAATSRNAGVLFLGDLWHHRGSLPVRLLNTMIKELQWDIPTIMLAGNHDQVSLGGLEHALLPIQEANPFIKVVDAPCVYNRAMFMPYRRRLEEVEAAISGAREAECRAIFGHFDIVGAKMNAAHQAIDGLAAGIFPSDIPVYSGHYHNPHTVTDTRIRYIGSPYQVTRSEAGQEKQLLVLDGTRWDVVEEIPLDVGPRFLTMAQVEKQIEEMKGGNTPKGMVRPGDQVRWELPPGELGRLDQGIARMLEENGVSVTTHVAPYTAVERIPGAEGMEPTAVYDSFTAAKGVPKAAVEAGRTLLEEVLRKAGPAGAGQPQEVNVQFDRLQVEGFGSFKDRTDYPLHDRGVRLLVGQNMADAGLDSNGAGKTTLVMAARWALSGKTDSRSESSATAKLNKEEVVHDECNVATVQVMGTANGKPFRVARSASKRGSGSLTFNLDGQELTEQEKELTQAHINEALSTELLIQSVFHSHASMMRLLEGTAKEFSQQVGSLVDLSVWAELEGRAKNRMSSLKIQAANAAGQLSAVQEEEKYLTEEMERSAADSEAWAARNRAEVDVAKETALELMQSLLAEIKAAEAARREVQALLPGAEAWRPAPAEPLPPPPSPLGPPPVLDESDLPPRELEEPEEDPQLAKRIQEAEEVYRAAERTQASAETSVARAADAKQRTAAQLRRYEDQLAAMPKVAARGGDDDDEDDDAVEESEDGGDGGAARTVRCDACGSEVSAEHFETVCAQLEGELDAQGTALRSAEAGVASAAEDVAFLSAALRELQEQQQAYQEAMRAHYTRSREVEEQWRRAEAEHNARLRADFEAKAAEVAEYNQAKAAADSFIEDQARWRADVVAHAKGALTTWDKCATPILPALEKLGITVPEEAPAERPAKPAVTTAEDVKALWAPADRVESAGYALQQELYPAFVEAVNAVKAAQGQVNTAMDRVRRLQVQRVGLEERVADAQTKLVALAAEQNVYKTVADAAGERGVQNFVLDGVAKQLESATREMLSVVAEGLTFTIETNNAKGKSEKAKEKMTRLIQYHGPHGLVTRSVRQLSQGERRRVALAFALALRRLIKERKGVHAGLVVLDEVVANVDDEGVARMSELLRSLPGAPTVLVVGQASDSVCRHFRDVDVVVKQSGCSSIQI